MGVTEDSSRFTLVFCVEVCSLWPRNTLVLRHSRAPAADLLERCSTVRLTGGLSGAALGSLRRESKKYSIFLMQRLRGRPCEISLNWAKGGFPIGLATLYCSYRADRSASPWPQTIKPPRIE